jgi:large-conductance mechanosensitive channel
MTALMLIFQTAAERRAEAWGRLIGFAVGFVLTLIIGLAIVVEIKKRKRKKEEAMRSRIQDTEVRSQNEEIKNRF